MAFSDEIYPNQPLEEVVCQIRFPSELAVETERHLFWDKIRDEYPTILVPQSDSGKAMALSPYHFRREDESMTILVAINSFGLSAARYPGYAEFSKEFFRICDLFGETYKDICKLNRVGWRYVNIIPFVREGNCIPLSQILTLSFKLPQKIPEKFKNLNLTFEAEMAEGTVRTKLLSIIRKDSGQEAFLLDFDYGAEQENLHFSKIKDYVNEAHTCTRQLFEDFITDEYRQYLKGDVL